MEIFLPSNRGDLLRAGVWRSLYLDRCLSSSLSDHNRRSGTQCGHTTVAYARMHAIALLSS